MEHNTGHVPVLLDEVLALLAPCKRGVLVDCTLGLGGHASAILRAWEGEGCLIGMDVDEDNLRLAKQNLSEFGDRVRLFHANFGELPAVLAEVGATGVDAILADLGVASTHLDQAQRGFSFQADGPLDMRMDNRLGRTAADLVNTMDETSLADLIYEYGQERYSRRVARAIVQARMQRHISRTRELADIVMKAMPPAVRRSRTGVHPATRTFQALRIAVNDELGVLDRLLANLPAVLNPGGRAAIISFHSLEDKRVKLSFNAWAETGTARRLTKKPIVATDDEVARNPRSRSAKLRGIERIQ